MAFRITPLEDLPLWARSVILVAIIGLVLFFMWVAIFVFSEGQAAAQPVELYQGIPLDAHLLELDKRALSEAYHQHIIKLWSIWLSDGAKESARISNGLRIARQAYGLAAARIEERQQQIKDKPQ